MWRSGLQQQLSSPAGLQRIAHQQLVSLSYEQIRARVAEVHKTKSELQELSDVDVV